MIGTIVDVEVRESRIRDHDAYLAIKFLDDYETLCMLYMSPKAEKYFKEFCKMTNWDYPTALLKELIGKIISVDSRREYYFQSRMITKWFIRSDWTER